MIDIEAQIVVAYQATASEQGEFVTLAALRRHAGLATGGARRADVDAALTRMYRAQLINLVPRSNQRALDDDQRAAGLVLGDEVKHLISIE